MDYETTADLRDTLDSMTTVKSARIYYYDGERVYEDYDDFDPSGRQDLEVEISSNTEDVIQPDIIARLAEEQIGFTHSLVDVGVIRTRSGQDDLTEHIWEF